MAEVFAWGDGRVLKLDRPEFNGVAAIEADVLTRVADVGVAAPRVFETTTVAGRLGVVMERLDGPLLSDVITEADDVDALAGTFADLHVALNARVIDGLPDLLTGVVAGVEASGLEPALVRELVALAGELDDGSRHLCHFDLHPENVVVTAHGWVVIDWLSASAGPPTADFARTALLVAAWGREPAGRFMTAVVADGLRARVVDRAEVDAWVRVLAAARIAEGFTGDYADQLAAFAAGTRRIRA